jgi:formate--tetrahydrofolate ligase
VVHSEAAPEDPPAGRLEHADVRARIAEREARAVHASEQALRRRLERIERDGYGHLPICVAKTQYSFSTDPKLLGAPTGHELNVREVRLSAGAGFVVVVCGDMMTMPGLPKDPSASRIDLADDGTILGLS